MRGEDAAARPPASLLPGCGGHLLEGNQAGAVRALILGFLRQHG